MSNKVLEFKIFATSLVGRGVSVAKAELAGLQRSVHGIASVGKAIGSVFGWVKDQALKVIGVAAVAFAALAFTVQKAFTFEKYQLQFKILFGNLELAKRHMDDLAKFAAATPFELEGIVEASRLLMTFSDGILGTQASLRLVGDAAAATGTGLAEVAMWVGRAYSMIAAGKPFGEAAMRLQEMGVLTAKARNEMEELQAKGASAGSVFGVLTKNLERFTGGMEDLAQSGDGLVSTLKDNVNLALKDFGAVFMEDAKTAIRGLIEWLDKLRANGTIEEWAKKARAAIATAADVIKAIAEGGGRRSEALGGLADIIIGAFQTAAGLAVELLMKAAPVIGNMIWDGVKSGMKAIGSDDRENMRAENELMDDIRNGNFKPDLFDPEWMEKEIHSRVKQNRANDALIEGKEALGGETWSERGVSRMKRGMDRLETSSSRERMAEKLLKRYNAAKEAGNKPEQARLGHEMRQNQIAMEREKAQAELKAIKDRRQAQIDVLKKNIGRAATPELAKKGMAELKDLTQSFEGSGVGAGSGTWSKQYSDFEASRKADAEDKARQKKALDDAEAASRKKARDEVARLQKDPSGQSAFEKAKKSVKEKYETEGTPFNANAAQTWKDILTEMKSELGKSKDRIADKRKDLAESQDKFRLSTLSPKELLKERQAKAADLEKQIGKEKDPEKILDLRGKLQDELEGILDLKTKGKGTKTRSVDVGEIFTRMYGQSVGRRDPAERTAVAAEETLKTLQRIEKEKGGLAP